METKQITLRLPFDLYKKIEQEAEHKGTTINSFLVNLFWNYVN